MKLIGSKMESDFRKELINSHNQLFSPESDSKLKQVLENAGHSTAKAYVLDWIPDQTEDIFTVLIDGKYLVSTEIDRFDQASQAVVERQEIKSYLKGLSRINQVRLLVAQDLANEKT
jgi:hypothetical protein